MKYYIVGKWRADLVGCHMRNITGRDGVPQSVKTRKFKITYGNDPNVFCMIDALDEDGTHEDKNLNLILKALDMAEKTDAR